METTKGSSTIRNMIYNGKNSLLPPKSPFPSISQSFLDCVSSPATGPKGIAKPRVGNSHHQRTSSENLLMEEQPSWLDELLNEPETPVRRGGHRRSSSDSFAYVDASSASSLMDHVSLDEYKYKNLTSLPSWASENYDNYSDLQQASFHVEPNFRGTLKNRVWDSSLNLKKHPCDVLSARGNILQSSALSCTPHEADGIPSTASEKWDSVESGPRDANAASERECPHVRPSASEADTRRSKQQFAQRSRVRKLQYIAELERNVQALQAEGSGASAELEFLRQQNLILGMENKALKQRLENIAQEQLIKHLEHEVLEREIGRLRVLHQQQQQQQTSSGHRRANSRDLDSKFANLSLKQKDPSSGCDPVSGPLHI